MLVAKKKNGRRNNNNKNSGDNNNGRSVESSTTTIPPDVRKSNIINSHPTSLELCGVEVHFPFRPYPCQKDYMSKVMDALHRSENALLESPTGTGKTLCLLCATLAWQREQARRLHHQQHVPPLLPDPNNENSNTTQNSSRLPVIIYASRTHSQLSQVVSELRNTRYRPRHAVLGSREQMCVHPKVNGKMNNNNNNDTTSMSEINHGCNKLNKERKCKFRNNLDGFVALPSSQHSSGEQQHQPVLDLEDLVKMGKSRSVCPFYLTRSHHLEQAELIFLPYNYLFDKDARSTTLAEVPWNNSIVIFDEAHNLESFASDAASFDLSSIDIAGCIQETSRAIGYLTTMPELATESNVKMDNLLRLKSLFLRFESFLQKDVSLGSFAGEYMMEIFQKGMDLTFHNCSIFISFVKQVSDLILEMQGSGTSAGTPKLDLFVSCLKRVYSADTEGKCLARIRVYRTHIRNNNINNNNNNHGNTNRGGGRTVSFWCFAPSLAMQELQSLRVRSILVTSGTLSPLPSYSLELGLNFPHTLENPHIIAPNQILVRVIGKGVSSKQLCSNYQRRDNSEYILELANTLIALARIIPGGMLIFFPSYNVMETCIERWGGPLSTRSKNNINKNYANHNNNYKNNFFEPRRRKKPVTTSDRNNNKYSFPHVPASYHNNNASSHNSTNTPWKRLLAQKAVVLEPKSTTDLKDAISEFEKYLALPKSSGCILMGVCRGKISEGIDFSDEKCRAVIITGLPFAPYLDAKVQLKREFLDATRAANNIQPCGDGGFSSKNVNKDKSKPTTKIAETLSGAEWYTQQAHRAVNQAVGRVIRHRHDYGAVLLLDSRFAEPRNQNGLSKWIRPHILPDEGVGKAIGSLTKFYREAKNNQETRKLQEEKKLGKKRSIPLIYEDSAHPFSSEDQSSTDELNFEKDMTKIAIIQTRKSKNDIPVKNHNLGVSDENPENIANSAIKINSNADNEKYDEDVNGYIRPEQVITRMDLKEVPLSRKSTSTSYQNNIKNKYNSSSKKQQLPMNEDNIFDNTSYLTVLKDIEQRNSITPTDEATGLQAIYNNSSRRSLSSPFAARRLYSIKSDSIRESTKSKSLSSTIASAWSGLEKKARDQKEVKQSQMKDSLSRDKSKPLFPGSNDSISVGSNKTNVSNSTFASNKKMKNQANLARSFYDLARNTLKSEDLIDVLSALRAMKVSEDSKNENSYLNSVKDLVSILVSYTDTQGEKNVHQISNGCKLLEFLYPMLHTKYRVLVEKMACKMKWEQSRFKKNCEAILSPQEYEKVASVIFPIMIIDEKSLSSKAIINQNDSINKQGKLSYLRKAHQIIPMFLQVRSNKNKTLLLESFYNIIPTCRCQDVKAMVKELLIQNKIKKMKNDEQKKLGEGGINPDFFINRETKPIQLDKTKNDTLMNIEETNNMEEALKKAEMKAKAQKQLVTELKRKSQNFYVTTPNSESRQPQTKLSERGNELRKNEKMYSPSRHSKRAKMIEIMTKQSNGQSEQKFKSSHSLDACLRRAMTEPLLKETPQLLRRSRSIKSNIPKEFLCVVCDSAPEKPLLADCGHSACMRCWSQWLQRSFTCPVCRKPTKKENLSRMVFERKVGNHPISFTQICESDSDSNIEDELEIIR